MSGARVLALTVIGVALFRLSFVLASDPICYHNPVIDRDFADPCILTTSSGALVAFSTNAGGVNIPCATSEGNLSSGAWTSCAHDALPVLPKWTKPGRVWAPKVVELHQKYLLFYTTVVNATGHQCVSVALSNSATGPYVDLSSSPLVCQESMGGTIDPSYFFDRKHDRHYLLFKNDGNCCNKPVFLWSQEFSVSPAGEVRLLETPTQLLGVTRPWEGTLVEAPAMHQHDDVYYLLYSCNSYDSWQYRVGYGVCLSPTGPCEKPTYSPFLQLASDIWGPGGTEFFTTRSGVLFICYHAWTAPRGSYETHGARSLRVDPVVFASHGQKHLAPTLLHGATDWNVCIETAKTSKPEADVFLDHAA